MASEGATPSEQAASEVAAIVADRVRGALESAEREAAEMRRHALDQASTDRAAVQSTAELVTARIDLIESEVHQLLQTLRDEVAMIVTEADRAAEGASAEPRDVPAATPARRRRGGLFRRHRGAPRHCAVCARTADPAEDAIERWQRVRGTALCPQCQADGWRIPAGGGVPHRPMYQQLQT
jgi:hypothetical protein